MVVSLDSLPQLLSTKAQETLNKQRNFIEFYDDFMITDFDISN